MKIKYDDEDKVDIPMSPLIDCVFLLLIFFLVTTMMKKWEKQIPLQLPPSTSSLSSVQSGTNVLILAVDDRRRIYQVVNHDAYTGQSQLMRIGNLQGFLSAMKKKRGENIPIDVTAYRTVPVQTVIEVFDQCQLAGFVKTRVRLGSKIDSQ